jgi:hypothetical protein
LDIIWSQRAQEPIHHLTPCPKTVVTGTAPFGEASHALLEAVAMQVGKSGNSDACNVLDIVALRYRSDAHDCAVSDIDPHIAGPAVWQKRVIEKEGRHWWPPSPRSAIAAAAIMSE